MINEMRDITDPLVSVYITNFNYGKYVEMAIESVLRQSMQDFELIIIDDGSTDESHQVISRYENEANVRAIFQRNKGLNKTNNVALKASRGKYLMRLDADDYLDTQALLVLSTVLEEDPALGMVFPDYYYINKNGEIIGHERRHDFSSDVSLLDQPAHGACTMIRKTFLLDIGGYSESYKCQDGYDLWLRFIEKYRVKNVNLPLFYYRRHSENLTNNGSTILSTRAQIKSDYVKRSKKKPLTALGIIPVRGKKIDAGCLSLEVLGNATLLDWVVKASLTSMLENVVVTSPDEEVLQYVTEKYKGKVFSVKRPAEFAEENVDLARTVEHVLAQEAIKNSYDAIMVLSTETPFRTSAQINEAIDTMHIFGVDSVSAIVPESDLFFRHNGQSMELISPYLQSPTLRFEREYIYRKVLGMNMVTKQFFDKEKKLMGGVMGHVTYDSVTATTVSNQTELEIAELIRKKMDLRPAGEC